MTADAIDTAFDLPADRVLLAAVERAYLENVVILGYRQDGREYFASTITDAAVVVWLIERMKLMLLQKEDDDHDDDEDDHHD